MLRLLIPLLLCCACTSAQPSLASADVVDVLNRTLDDSFARATEPLAFQFPRDHGAHNDYATEWWYYTGNLTGDDGGAYGFQLTFFRSALAAGESHERPSTFATHQLYMAHFAVTSAPDRQHLSFDRFSRGSGGMAGATADPRYEVWLDDWRVQEVGPAQMHILAATDTEDGRVAIDLTLTETRAPLLHGEAGLSRKGQELHCSAQQDMMQGAVDVSSQTDCVNANHYYSLVQMDTTGRLVFRDVEVGVSGLSWMDHEFGTSALTRDAVGWDWFAVTLDNGVVLMFAEIRTESGGKEDIFESTLSFPNGRQISIRQDEFELMATGQWTSSDSGITYPSGWHVLFPEYDIELTIEPLIDDQEMDVAFTYYEGATVVNGTMNGASVTGRGYVELTGYSASQGVRRAK